MEQVFLQVLQVSPDSIIPPLLHTHSSIFHPHSIMFSPSTSVSPVSIIPPLLHTHSSIFHPHSIMFFSQYFSFPCQYFSHISPYSSIHLPPTLYNVFLPVLQFPLSVSFHHCSILIHLPTITTLKNFHLTITFFKMLSCDLKHRRP